MAGRSWRHLGVATRPCEVMATMNFHRTLMTIGTMKVEERIEVAAKKAEQLPDYIISLIRIHTNNLIVNYTDLLSKQIGTSSAAYALNDFQMLLYHGELMKLTALWDRADLDKCSIPTIHALIDDPKVIRRLFRRFLKGTFGEIRSVNFSDLDDPLGSRLRYRRSSFRRARERFAQHALAGLDLAKRTEGSAQLRSIVDHRARYFAHNLDLAHPSVEAKPYTPPKHGYERELLNITLEVANGLNAMLKRRLLRLRGQHKAGQAQRWLPLGGLQVHLRSVAYAAQAGTDQRHGVTVRRKGRPEPPQAGKERQTGQA